MHLLPDGYARQFNSLFSFALAFSLWLQKWNLVVIHILRFDQFAFVASGRPDAKTCMEHAWIMNSSPSCGACLPPHLLTTTRLVDFIERRRHQVFKLMTAWYLIMSVIYGEISSYIDRSVCLRNFTQFIIKYCSVAVVGILISQAISLKIFYYLTKFW